MFLGSGQNVKPSKLKTSGSASVLLCLRGRGAEPCELGIVFRSRKASHKHGKHHSSFIPWEYGPEEGYRVMLAWKMLPTGGSFACTSEGHALLIFDLNIW